MKTSGFARLLSFGFVLACMIVFGWAVMNRQALFDQLMVWQYQPSSAIEELARDASMSERGTFLFYASQPSLDGTQTFNQQCHRSEPQSAILGCYTNLKIYVFDVRDARLDGVEEVTAAHEMLHAAWDRLSDQERQDVTKLLEAEYKKRQDKALNERMAYYARTEPTERSNELHSILGTEFNNLSPELERHYQRYFVDRSQVVRAHQRYEAVFAALEKQANQLLAEMKLLKTTIETREAEYTAKRAAVEQEGRALEQDYRSLDRSDGVAVDAYNTRVNHYNASLAQLQGDFQTLNALIDTYNDKVNQYNQLVIRQQDLQKGIDSSLAPVPAAN